jgi:hypothetical protein
MLVPHNIFFQIRLNVHTAERNAIVTALRVTQLGITFH